ncbi:MAG: serine/threonine protein kinase [bacterium]|nr:serine/threonine protein kinase [bacterium]
MGLRRRQRIGQYRIEGRLGEGGFASVYKAYDTVEGIHVAIKAPHDYLVDRETLTSFRQEVRLVAPLDHPNVLPIKTAGVIDGRFVIVTPLGIESLAERMRRRMARKTVLSFAEQLLEGLATAHKRRIIHCDVKPENLIIFAENRLRLADFGLARVALRSLDASGSGTVGFLAPEQALGKPSLRSDVFAAGLIVYRLMSGELPEWPFRWPYKGIKKVRRAYGPGLVDLVRKATAVDDQKRFKDAVHLLRAFRRIESTAIRD